LRGRYSEIRRSQHPSLALALGKGARRPLMADDMAVRSVYRWSTRLAERGFLLVGLLALLNINVEDDATLSISNTQSLWANDITIGGNGRLAFSGGYVKVTARSVSGPNPMLVPFPGFLLKYLIGS
jgi:hypothetical protein